MHCVNAPATRRMRGALCAGLVAALVIVASCGPERGNPRYAAEKRLFKARKMREDVVTGGMKSEFLAKAVDGYRRIVSDYEGAAARDAEIEKVVVSAQMELAELEFQGQLLRESRSDFEKAFTLAMNVPPARANAIYSAGVISEELGELAEAANFYERFFEGFLRVDSLASTARMNRRYLVTPLKLADLSLRLGSPDRSSRWLAEARRIFSHVIDHETDPAILKETRFNLLAAYLQEKDWNRALGLVKEMGELYREPRDVSSLLYIEAMIYHDGLNNPQKAMALYLSIADAHPKEREAPDALLAAAGIHRKSGRLKEAKKLHERVIGSYRDRSAEAVEAEWQIAQILELEGDPEAASLRYRSIYADFPETLQGFEAPLRIAKNYRDRGQTDAAKSACDRALEHYEKLASSGRPMSTRIMAEQYIVRALVEDKRWNEAVERLLALSARYPDYTPFRENYLRAASLYEKEMGDEENAKKTLAACAAKYPGTELARAAEKELARLTR